MTEGALLKGQDLAVWHGERCLFEGLSFALGAAQLALLIGANGSGKTTLLRVLAGIAEPTHGAVTWRGTSLAELESPERAEMAYRGHLEALKKELTLRENLEFHAALWQQPDSLDTLLGELRLTAVADTRARYLSAGQKRRVSLAMLRLSRAKLWLLDEPTTNIDADGRALLRKWVGEHLAGGGLAVVATHQPDELAVPGTLAIELS